MISEFKIIDATGRNSLTVSIEDSTEFPQKWIKVKINDGKEIDIKHSELTRALGVNLSQ